LNCLLNCFIKFIEFIELFMELKAKRTFKIANLFKMSGIWIFFNQSKWRIIRQFVNYKNI
jgi:hypothetical protein